MIFAPTNGLNLLSAKKSKKYLALSENDEIIWLVLRNQIPCNTFILIRSKELAGKDYLGPVEGIRLCDKET